MKHDVDATMKSEKMFKIDESIEVIHHTVPNAYINEDGDIWVKKSDAPNKDRAEKIALSFAYEDSLTFAGEEQTYLTDHEYGCGHDDCYQKFDTWHFIERSE